MKYEKTKIKNDPVAADKAIKLQAAKKLSTPRLILIVLDRHKVPLLVVGNVILVLNWVFPLWFQVVLSMF